MIIKIEDLIKKFKEKIVLDHFNLSLEKGDVLGLIGPNGCGKTTSIMCMLSLLKYDSGTIEVFGKKDISNEYEIKKKIGIVPQELAVFNNLTVKENIDYFCGLYISNKNERKRLVNEAIEFTGLQSHEKMLEKKLSGGLKRRLNIACGISHKPELVILDEPTVAVDAQSRKFILDGIKNLAENGSSILYTTHYLDEAEYLCNKISIMDNGKNILTGDMQTLINGVSVKEKITVVGFIKPEIISTLENQDEIINIERKENQVTLSYSSDTGNIKKLIYLLDENNVVYEEIFSKKPKLEDIFLEMTGKELRE
ncbi:ABC transporter ATP-binding protein [Parvimonas micra]|uniref:ABC transporter ATP-binding protein n=1 Tax=Parvimonas micra TaxID=33033 RepID=A0A9X3H9D2_9FIRM|nr:ABC transporter ATP-binding protein [Parvimonas micra]MCZ7407180.1 ABC transporter ATP-binding protein [Parvimonas micra]MCZ7410933.1 ABC transporter ATP-binding protein [Parvimonas micra]MCZ7411458.1 ABC transporter ATP-binding protein [Parvimonas micra]WBB37369.1 ABC transporter ATP-binding protein [Parvimonas micra]